MAGMIRQLRKFVAPEIIFGNGSRFLCGEYCAKLSMHKPMIVSDPGVVEAGWTGQIETALREAGIDHITYTHISPNPKDGEVTAGARLFLDSGCDSIVAVGGGSPMDCAKGIGILASNGGEILDYEGVDQIADPLPPMLFIPTTAGTSADVSQFSIINNVKEKTKFAIVSKVIIPDISLIDPETTLTMSPVLTACTGMDALVHAVEAFVSTASSRITDVHALEAIRLLGQHLPRVLHDPDNMDIRESIMLASMEAGLAFSNAILGAVHAMAHSLGGLLDLPHGECNSLLLEHVTAFNFPAAPERFQRIAETLGLDTRGKNGSEIKGDLVSYFRRLRHDLGIRKTLAGVGVKRQDIPDLSEKADHDACLVTNPRKIGRKDIETIYQEAL